MKIIILRDFNTNVQYVTFLYKEDHRTRKFILKNVKKTPRIATKWVTQNKLGQARYLEFLRWPLW